MKNKKIVLLILVIALLTICSCGKKEENVKTPKETSAHETSLPQSEPQTEQTETEPETEETEPETEAPVTTEIQTTVKKEPAVTEPPQPAIVEPEITYISEIMIVNKTYPLPSTYNPGVDPTAQAALNEMFAAAAQDGISLWVASGFRSYNTQKWLYNSYVRQDGQALADTYSARPGHSEHQTGLAFDLNLVDDSFAYTPAGQWLAANSWKYGYIIRYPEGKEAQTGYKYEPWHVRYIGKDLAQAVFESGLSLEEYLGITSIYA